MEESFVLCPFAKIVKVFLVFGKAAFFLSSVVKEVSLHEDLPVWQGFTIPIKIQLYRPLIQHIYSRIIHPAQPHEGISLGGRNLVGPLQTAKWGGKGNWSLELPRFNQIPSGAATGVLKLRELKSNPKQGKTEHRFKMLRNLLIKIMSEPVTAEGKQTCRTRWFCMKCKMLFS